MQAPVAGLISASSAVIGSIAGAKGEALFSIIARSEFDLVGMVPVRDITKLAISQTARIKIIGTGEVDGRVRRIASTIEPNSQLGQVFVGVALPRRLLVNSSGAGADQDRAELRHRGAADRDPVRLGRHRGAGGAVGAGRDPAGRGRADVGRPGRNQEGIEEGDTVVARAGALLREGDPVRPVMVRRGGEEVGGSHPPSGRGQF